MTPSQKFLDRMGLKDPVPASNEKDISPENGRRSFFKKSALGGIALGGSFLLTPIEDVIAQTTSKVSRYSAPSDLKITDMRYAETAVMGRTSIIRIDTNQGISGWGEVRDGADVKYALMLKSRLLGKNPCNVEMLFKSIKHFGTFVAKHIMFLHGNCLAAGIATKCDFMPTRLNQVRWRNKKS
jgi:hypothetical protein